MLWKSVVVHHLVILYHNSAPQCTTSYHGMVCAKFTMLNISKKYLISHSLMVVHNIQYFTINKYQVYVTL